MASKIKPKKSPVDKAIAGHERFIARMDAEIKRIRRAADQKIIEISNRVSERAMLLNVLKRGG